jgi:hypothetical protein
MLRAHLAAQPVHPPELACARLKPPAGSGLANARNEVVPIRPIKPLLFCRYGLSLDFSDHVGLPMGDMRECIFHRPGVFGLGSGEQSIPILTAKVVYHLIQAFELLNRALDYFVTSMAHKNEPPVYFNATRDPTACTAQRLALPAPGWDWTISL